MGQTLVVALALLLGAAISSVGPSAWDRASDQKLKRDICEAFVVWLKENEESPDFKTAQMKPAAERTVRERTVFDAVTRFRADVERCQKVT